MTTKSASSNLVNLVDPDYPKLLAKSEEEGSLELFLRAIDCIAESRMQDDSALKTWPHIASSAKTADILKQILSWLGRLRFESAQEATESQRPDNAGDISAPYELGKEFAKSGRDVDKMTKEMAASPELEPYLPFYGAFPLKDLLHDHEFETISNVCKTIAGHLKAIHRIPEEEDRSSTMQVTQRWLRTFIDEKLLPWAEATAREQDAADQRVSFFDPSACRAYPYLTAILADEINLEDESTFPDGFSPEVLQDLLPCLPQSLFDAVVDLVVDIYSFEDGASIACFFDVLTSLPIGRPVDSLPDFNRQTPSDSALREKLHVFKQSSDIPVMTLGRVFQLVFNYQINFLDILHLAQQEICYADSYIWTEKALADRLIRVNNELTHYRLLSGHSIPYEEGLTAYFAAAMFDIGESVGIEFDLDISLWLAAAPEWGTGGAGYESGVNTPFTPMQHYGSEPSLALAQRSSVFRRTIERAEKEGLNCLAESLLIFYLFTQGLYAPKSSIIDWSWVGVRLNRLREGSASTNLRNCLSICLQYAESIGASKEFDRMNLEFYQSTIDLPENRKGTDIGLILLRWEALERKRAREFIEDSIELRFRTKVKKEQLDEIIDAEASFRQMLQRSESRPSTTPDYSHVVIHFFRPIESILAEVVARVGDLPRFQQLVGFSNLSRTPTVADHIRMFRLFDRLPDTVKAHLRKKKCRLGSDRDSIVWIDSLRKLRNQAAHDGNVTLDQFKDIHTLMFEKRSLESFFRALPPLTD